MKTLLLLTFLLSSFSSFSSSDVECTKEESSVQDVLNRVKAPFSCTYEFINNGKSEVVRVGSDDELQDRSTNIEGYRVTHNGSTKVVREIPQVVYESRFYVHLDKVISTNNFKPVFVTFFTDEDLASTKKNLFSETIYDGNTRIDISCVK